MALFLTDSLTHLDKKIKLYFSKSCFFRQVYWQSFCLKFRTFCFLESEVKASSDSDLRKRKLCENNMDQRSTDSKQNLFISMQLSNIISPFLYIYGLMSAVLMPLTFFIKHISTQRSKKPEFFFSYLSSMCLWTT